MFNDKCYFLEGIAALQTLGVLQKQMPVILYANH